MKQIIITMIMTMIFFNCGMSIEDTDPTPHKIKTVITENEIANKPMIIKSTPRENKKNAVGRLTEVKTETAKQKKNEKPQTVNINKMVDEITPSESNKPIDYYNVETGRWEEADGSPYPTDLTNNELYDWEIENGYISEAREQYCRTCTVWAKYGTCPICGEKVF